MGRAEAIPKIIHQIWKTEGIPEQWRPLQETWKQFHPNWEYRLWTDEGSLRLVEQLFPDFLSMFTSYSYDIQRADASRYFILYQYGGVYVDLDFECLRPVDELLTHQTFIIGYEPKSHARINGDKSLIGNAFIASVPRHRFLWDVIQALKQLRPEIVLHKEVLTTTGPMMVNHVLKRYARKDLCLLDPQIVYPLSAYSKQLDQLVNQKGDCLSIKRQCIAKGSYAIHYWSNSWVKNLAGTLTNPEPLSVDGYRFYPGQDSPGHDISNARRDIKTLASRCDESADAFGFNTDGFLKDYILPMDQWRKIRNPNGNEGLYIKISHLPRVKRRSSLAFRLGCGLLKAFGRLRKYLKLDKKD
jgi:inositol phosphorylceramide mannosyltransferase catalytic subunit